jgi:hypothetical protein
VRHFFYFSLGFLYDLVALNFIVLSFQPQAHFLVFEKKITMNEREKQPFRPIHRCLRIITCVIFYTLLNYRYTEFRQNYFTFLYLRFSHITKVYFMTRFDICDLNISLFNLCSMMKGVKKNHIYWMWSINFTVIDKVYEWVCTCTKWYIFTQENKIIIPVDAWLWAVLVYVYLLGIKSPQCKVLIIIALFCMQNNFFLPSTFWEITDNE